MNSTKLDLKPLNFQCIRVACWQDNPHPWLNEDLLHLECQGGIVCVHACFSTWLWTPWEPAYVHHCVPRTQHRVWRIRDSLFLNFLIMSFCGTLSFLFKWKYLCTCFSNSKERKGKENPKPKVRQNLKKGSKTETLWGQEKEEKHSQRCRHTPLMI